MMMVNAKDIKKKKMIENWVRYVTCMCVAGFLIWIREYGRVGGRVRVDY